MFHERRLGDLVEELTVGHVGSMADEYQSTGIPFLRSLNIQPYRITTDEIRYISDEFHARLRKSALKPGDVVIVRTGKPGTCAVIPDWLEDANCSDLVIARCGPQLRPRYLAYWVNSLASDHIGSSLVGAVQQHFNVGAARVMPILLPEVREQDAILSVLSALDDKIELNRRMNETLEALAQAIFKDWFVTFGPTRRKMDGATDPISTLGGLIPDPAKAAALGALFPDSFGEDGLPDGWQSHKLKGLASLSKVSTLPSKTPDQLFEHHSLPAYDKGEEPALEQGSAILSNKFVVPENAVLLSKLNPEISRVWVPNRSGRQPQIASTEFLVLVPTEGVGRSLLCAICRDPSFRLGLEGMVTGTSKSHQRISPPALMDKEIVHGAFDAFKGFDALAAPLLDKRLALRAESRTLAETRDYLLPKLMSGAVRVRDAEKAVS